MINVNQSKLPTAFCFAAIAYLVGISIFDISQSSFAYSVEIVLGLSYFSRGFWKYHFVGIRKKDLPDLEKIKNYNCNNFASLECRELCFRIKQLLDLLEHSGKIGSNGKTAWKIVKYGTGAGGICLAIATDSIVTGGMGAALCLPSVFEWAEEDRGIIDSLNKKVDKINDLHNEFVQDCLEEV